MTRLLAALSITYSLLRLGGSMIQAWLSLGWKVRKARKAFETELMREGISKEDARRLSSHISELKDQLLETAKSPIRRPRKRKDH